MQKYLVLVLLLCVSCVAQLPGWDISINGNFSSITNAATNNGWATTEAVRVSPNFALRSDQIVTLTPTALIVLGRVEYRRQLSDFILPNQYVNTSNFEPFVNLGGGTAQSNTDGIASTTRPAFVVGAGFDYAAGSTGMFTIRPLDVSYVRASIFEGGGQLLGNHLQLLSGLGIRFGSIAQMSRNKAVRAEVRAKYRLDQ